MPGVEDCQFDGEVRSLNLPGAGDIKERILFHDAPPEPLNILVLNPREP